MAMMSGFMRLLSLFCEAVAAGAKDRPALKPAAV